MYLRGGVKKRAKKTPKPGFGHSSISVDKYLETISVEIANSHVFNLADLSISDYEMRVLAKMQI
jgi:hypothetical protein